ncbi:hypothetical protein G9A89_012762 [Geosiphon pyriformis]|nr:hypothetical protein G9A89_012762 [Geosiphon pyriformis]
MDYPSIFKFPMVLLVRLSKFTYFFICIGDYSYLSQQSKEHFAAHNLEFIELNSLLSCLICFSVEKQSSRQFQDFWNWFLNEHSTETYTAYTIYYFDQAYFKDNFEERNISINQLLYSTIFKQHYQTVPIFDIFSSKSEHSTQTVIPEPMAQDPVQANILAALQGIQTALGQKNNTPLPLFRGNAQDPIEWLDDFKRATTANQYDNEYKFQIVGGYLQDSSAIWFLQETNHMELEKKIQGPGEIVTEYAKAIRKLIKCVDSGKNWTEEQKIHSFTKGLRTNLSYALWPLLALKDNPTMDMAIELAQ